MSARETYEAALRSMGHDERTVLILLAREELLRFENRDMYAGTTGEEEERVN